eukprot:1745074-Pyramimonas_sp.AAC.1
MCCNRDLVSLITHVTEKPNRGWWMLFVGLVTNATYRSRPGWKASTPPAPRPGRTPLAPRRPRPRGASPRPPGRLPRAPSLGSG